MEKLSRKIKQGATVYLSPGSRRSVEVFKGGKAIFLNGVHKIDRITLHPGATVDGGFESKVKCDVFTVLGTFADVSGSLPCLVTQSEIQQINFGPSTA